MSAAEFRVSLTPFADSPTAPVRAIAVSGCLTQSGRLELDYTLRGRVADIVLPAPATAPGRRDELWHHSCFEVFARPGSGEPYFEWNFSASGDWAAYAFAAYRGSRAELEGSQPVCRARQPQADELILTAAANFPVAPRLAAMEWCLNIAAVIEDRAGALSYWALCHPRPYPDFHDPAAFSLALASC